MSDQSKSDEIDALGLSFRSSKKPQIPVLSRPVQKPCALPKIQPFNEDYYKTNHTNRGIALIFNHYRFDKPHFSPRKGTEKDCHRVKHTFSSLGFDTIVHDDLKLGQLENELERVASMDHSDSDCLVVIVMTHGDPDILNARDEAYYVPMLWEPFTADKCPTLAGKPKLFFIQACRGEATDDGVQCRVEFDGNSESKPVTIKIPKMADFLIMYATPMGNYSFRSPSNGSWFIQTLCSQLEKHAKQYDLQRILVHVNREMAFSYASNVPADHSLHNKKQVGQVVSSLTRLLHFYRNSDK